MYNVKLNPNKVGLIRGKYEKTLTTVLIWSTILSRLKVDGERK